MAVMKCKMCGGDLNVTEGVSVVECEYCGSRQTIPNQDSEKKLTLFARADRLRRANEFDKAAGVYESIVAEFPEEAEAYWGLVLCRYGIEYVDDPATGKKVPTCHRSSFDSILEDADFDQASENADPIARRQYREEAKAIEDIRRGILEVSSKEEPYDIFICYKETDENGGRTIDSVIAQDVYDALTEKGYRVFFSRISLEDKLGTEYEPYIFAALNSAKVMLAFGTDFEYFNAVWVKNEWSRFLALMAAGQKKTLIPCYKNLDAYDMPKEFQRLQAQDMGKVGAIQDLLRGIGKIIPRETEVVEKTVVVQQSAAPAAPGVESLLKRGWMFLTDQDWAKADEYFDKVLDIAPENGDAYAGKLCAQMNYRRLGDMASDTDAWYDWETNPAFDTLRELFRLAVDSESFESRVKAIRILREAGREFTEAKTAVEKVREKPGITIQEAAVIFGLSDVQVRPDGSKLYDKVMRYGSEALKAQVRGYADAARKKRQEKVYAQACQALDDIKCEQEVEVAVYGQKLRKAEELFAGICGYRDADEKRAECLRLAEEAAKREAKRDGEKRKKVRPFLEKRRKELAPVAGLVACGKGFVVGVQTDGTVMAVGENDNGQCNVSEWTDIVAVAAGFYHTVGLKSDGSVVAVGKNDEGQCNVSDWRNIVAVVAGAFHTIGLKSDGTAVAVGNNQFRQCDVDGWRDIVAVASSNILTMGLRSDGTVVCAGSDLYTDGVSEWRNIAAILAYFEWPCGVTNDGILVGLDSQNYREVVFAYDANMVLHLDGTVEDHNEILWTDIAAVVGSDSHIVIGVKTDGTVVAKANSTVLSKDLDEEILRGIQNWKLFNSVDTLEQERADCKALQKAEAERRRQEAEAKAKAEAERQAKIDALNTEKQSLQAELPTLKGLFSGGKRRQIEARLAQIGEELKKL